MVAMTFSQYDELMEKFEAMPNPIHDYGITEEDMKRMNDDPDKYYEFVMYLSTRPWYKDKGDNTHVFINSDALKADKAATMLECFISEQIFDNMLDDEDDEILSEDDEAAMKAMLGLK